MSFEICNSTTNDQSCSGRHDQHGKRQHTTKGRGEMSKQKKMEHGTHKKVSEKKASEKSLQWPSRLYHCRLSSRSVPLQCKYKKGPIWLDPVTDGTDISALLWKTDLSKLRTYKNLFNPVLIKRQIGSMIYYYDYRSRSSSVAVQQTSGWRNGIDQKRTCRGVARTGTIIGERANPNVAPYVTVISFLPTDKH